MPASAPMRSAGKGLTNPEAGVIATSPATAPEIAPSTLGFPFLIHSANIQPSAAAAAPKWVATKALVARVDEASALPALNPNHPTHNRHAPTALKTRLCGRIGSYGNPLRLPKCSAHTNAETPDVMCTTVPPAKSKHGNFPPLTLSKPPLPHTMCAIGKYTTVVQRTVNSSMPENFMRSANAPEISAGVMTANMSW